MRHICVFVTAGMCLPSRCLVTIGGFKELWRNKKITQQGDLISLVLFLENKKSRLKRILQKQHMRVGIGIHKARDRGQWTGWWAFGLDKPSSRNHGNLKQGTWKCQEWKILFSGINTIEYARSSTDVSEKHTASSFTVKSKPSEYQAYYLLLVISLLGSLLDPEAGSSIFL
jgi:hypothetical protein